MENYGIGKKHFLEHAFVKHGIYQKLSKLHLLELWPWFVLDFLQNKLLPEFTRVFSEVLPESQFKRVNYEFKIFLIWVWLAAYGIKKVLRIVSEAYVVRHNRLNSIFEAYSTLYMTEINTSRFWSANDVNRTESRTLHREKRKKPLESFSSVIF